MPGGPARSLLERAAQAFDFEQVARDRALPVESVANPLLPDEVDQPLGSQRRFDDVVLAGGRR